jgi:hypothetical protein
MIIEIHNRAGYLRIIYVNITPHLNNSESKVKIKLSYIFVTC